MDKENQKNWCNCIMEKTHLVNDFLRKTYGNKYTGEISPAIIADMNNSEPKFAVGFNFVLEEKIIKLNSGPGHVPRKQQKVQLMAAHYCPFCGKKYDDEEQEAVEEINGVH